VELAALAGDAVCVYAGWVSNRFQVFGFFLNCYWSISVAPVRGGTYFSLPAAKKKQAKESGSNRQPISGSPAQSH
jgi:hypothetical protein